MSWPIDKLIQITRRTQYNLNEFQISSLQPNHFIVQDILLKHRRNCKPGSRRPTYTAYSSVVEEIQNIPILIYLSICICALFFLALREVS